MADLRYGEQSLQNFTPLMDLVPREENMLERMGLFAEKDYVTESITTFERRVLGTDEMYSVARGADRQYAGDDEAKEALLKVPFFTLDKSVKPSEVHQLREFLTAADPETVRSRVEKIIARIQRSHTRLHKNAMYEALVNNKTFAKDKNGADRPNFVKNFQTAFEVANSEMFNGAADGVFTGLDLTDQTSNPMDTFELFRKHVFNAAGDEGDNYQIIFLMGQGAFTALKNHSDVQEAFANYTDGKSLLQRLGGLQTARVLEMDGNIFLEDLSGKVANNQIIGFVRGIEDMFMMKYGLADTIAAENGDEAPAEAYLYIRESARSVSIESEAAVVACITRPELIARFNSVTI